MYHSDSSGKYFTPSLSNVHRSLSGLVDYERMQIVDGIILSNVVDNYQQVREAVKYGSIVAMEISSRISFDDGRHWVKLKAPAKDANGVSYDCGSSCFLNLYSISNSHNLGYQYSDPSAAGIIIGQGNVGSKLINDGFDKSSLFVSTDFGISWVNVAIGPHLHETLDSGIIVISPIISNSLKYSMDYGKSFVSLDFGIRLKLKSLTSDDDSFGKAVLVVGREVDENGNFKADYDVAISVVLNQFRQCNDNDFEWVVARNIDEDYKCLFGKKQSFRRRKSGTECNVNVDKVFVKSDTCECSDEDFECDYNFILKGNECVLVDGKTPVIPDGSCLNGGQYLGSSGWRKIPGDSCVAKSGVKQKDEKIMRDCPSNTSINPINPMVSSKLFDNYVVDSFYLVNSSIVLVRESGGRFWRSEDDGGRWDIVSLDGKETGKDIEIVAVKQHDHVSERVFVVDNSNGLWYSNNYGKSFSKVSVPLRPSSNDWIDFHPKEKDWLVYVGVDDEKNVAYYSTDNGGNWKKISDYVKKCLFAEDSNFDVDPRGVYCSEYEPKVGRQGSGTVSSNGSVLKLVLYTDFDKGDRLILKERLVDYYVFDKFMAVSVDENDANVLYISTDGKEMKKVYYPPDFSFKTNTYTILQSPTGKVFMNYAKNPNGVLLYSNSDGNYFSVSLDQLKMNSAGYVDFERIHLAGVLIANQVVYGKNVVSRISYDDGFSWTFLQGPQDYCSQNNIRNCTLHLHSRSELSKNQALYSVETAPGLIVANGNVGDFLTSYEDSSLFMSRDGGKTWSYVAKGPKRYIFADHGGLIVYFDDLKPTKSYSYSLNLGKTWFDNVFSDKGIKIIHLFTDSGFSGLEIMVLGNVLENGKFFTAKIDLSNTLSEQCKDSDYEKFTLDYCFLGKKVSYFRRRQDSVCHIGENYLPPKETFETCSCSKIDLECAKDFYRDPVSGECKLISIDSEKPVDCKDNYKGRSGYQVMSKSVCTNKDSLQELKPVDRSCDFGSGGGGGTVGSNYQTFDVDFKKVLYFTNSTNVLALDSSNSVYKSINSGKEWQKLDSLKNVIAIEQNEYFKERVYLLTTDSTYYYSGNKADSFVSKTFPLRPNSFGAPKLEFNADEEDWVIFVGDSSDCPSGNCHAVAYYTKDNDKWNEFLTYTKDCEWGRDADFRDIGKSVVFCDVYDQKSGNQKFKSGYSDSYLYKSETFFEKSQKILDQPIVGFAINDNYLIAAIVDTVNGEKSLSLKVSTDGNEFK